MDSKLYNIVRWYSNAKIRRRVIEYNLTLEQAQAHCDDPQTSASTCTSKAGIARTRNIGFWFDGYTEQK